MKQIVKIALSYINGKNKSFLTKFHSMLAIFGILIGVTALITVSSVMQGYSNLLYKNYYNGYDISVVGKPEAINQLYKEFKESDKTKKIWKIEQVKFTNAKIKSASDIFITEKYKDLKEQEIAANINFLKNGKQYLPIFIEDNNNKIIDQDVFKIKKGIDGLGYQVYMNEKTFKNSFFAPYTTEKGFQIEWNSIKERDYFLTEIRDYGNDVKMKTWVTKNTDFLKAIELEQFVITLVLFFIILVSCFNIISTLTLIITEKKQDIYILKTIGFSNKKILSIFSLCGILLGGLGILLGSIFGILITKNLTWIMDVLYQITGMRLLPESILKIPYILNIQEVMSINQFTIIVVIISSLIPAITTLRISPAEGLKDA